MAQTSSASAAAALNWNEQKGRKWQAQEAPESNIERFNNPYASPVANTYGFRGYTENNMFMPKQPLRHPVSADVSADANRYFRRESPPNWEASTKQQPPRLPTPTQPQQQEQRQKEPDWMQTKRSSPPPVPDMTISPRYEDQRPHRHPTIRDPLGQLTADEKRKKIEEIYIAEQDLEGVRQRREEQKYAKLEEQQKIRELQDSYYPWGHPGGGAPNRIREMQQEFDPYGQPGGGAPTLRALLDADFQPFGRPGGGAPVADNRKMRFTEHQMTKPPSPTYLEPKSRYDEENRGEERVRPSMEQRNTGSERREDKLRHQKNEIDDLRRSLNQLKREHEFDTSREPLYHHTNDKMASTTDKVNEMLEGQSKQLRNLQEEINRLKEEPHLLRPAGLPTEPLINRGAQLKAQDDLFYSPRDRPFQDNNPRAQSDDLLDVEPQTERGYRMRNREGESSLNVSDYMQTSPRRVPIGRFYNKKSTYVEDFNFPIGRSRHILGNPNKETYEAYAPYGQEGSGAPRVNEDGQRSTRISGAMHFKDVSGLPKAGKEHKIALRQENRRQAANDIIKRNAEMAHAREGFVETVDSMRSQHVGYPKYNPSGTIASHPLVHTFSQAPYTDPATKSQYHAFLASQIEEKHRNLQLGHLEERRQAREHFLTEDGLYGRHGGGNIKGSNLRKINLNRAIHNPQSTSQYYNKVRLEDEISPREILNKFKPRITINSTHKNLYEYPQGHLQTNYTGRSPYAEFGGYNM